MALVEIVTVLALLQFIYFGVLVGRARERFGVKAPAISGHEIFERYFRVQMNTLELLVVFLPALWLATAFVAARWAALRAYVAEPSKRSIGFALTSVPILVLLAIDLIGAVGRLIRD
jgi:glutathione S-transferase